MIYNIDRSLISDGIIQYTTDSDCKYLAKIFETAPGSGLWSIDFVKVSGTPSPVEVFRIMKTLTEASMEYAQEKKIDNVVIFIAGDTQEEINKKTAAFQRWLVDDWNFEIIKNMEIKISGMRNYFTEIPTNTFMMKRKTSSTQKQISTTGNFEIKFCFNCGTENKGFQFCPNCGTNLKQA